MDRILALDCSTKSTGYACYDDNKNLVYGVITASSTSLEKRISIMRDGILDLIKKYNINKVVLEEVRPDNININVTKALTWLQGCIAVALYEFNKKIEIEFIGPSSWRSKIGIQGYRIKREEQKKKDIAYANKHFNLTLGSDQDDEADAICILAAHEIDSNSNSNSDIVYF